MSHGLNYPDRATKAQLLEIAFQNAPPKKYIVDEAEKAYEIDIIR